MSRAGGTNAAAVSAIVMPIEGVSRTVLEGILEGVASGADDNGIVSTGGGGLVAFRAGFVSDPPALDRLVSCSMVPISLPASSDCKESKSETGGGGDAMGFERWLDS